MSGLTPFFDPFLTPFSNVRPDPFFDPFFDLHSILKKLSSLPPSETRRAIVRIMQEAGLKVSVHSLHERVIKELQDQCKAMLVPELAATK
jgi:hypothetical protein